MIHLYWFERFTDPLISWFNWYDVIRVPFEEWFDVVGEISTDDPVSGVVGVLDLFGDSKYDKSLI